MEKAALESILQVGDEPLDLGLIEVYLEALAVERWLPLVAVGVCTIRIEESAPPLCALLERAAAGDILSDDAERLLFRGLHILGGARIERAWPALARLLRRPADELDGLLGDAITEGLNKIVSGVFDGDAEGLFDLITDMTLDEFVREALLKAVTFLTSQGRIERELTRGFLTRLYETRAFPDGDMGWIGWADAISQTPFGDLQPLFEQAWKDGRIPPGIMERKHFIDDLAKAERAPQDPERFEDAHVGYIEDVAEALMCFDYDDDDDEMAGEQPDDVEPFFSNPWTRQEPTINPLRDVGRNDPCPCGSGLKAKKCCLAGK